jgi:hypothetical protein
MSPFLSNVMLTRFDNAVLAKNYKAVRYADDLIFFGSSEHECNEIYKFCEKNLLVERGGPVWLDTNLTSLSGALQM